MFEYSILGSFNNIGVAEGKVPPWLLPLSSLQIHVHAPTKNRVAIGEVSVQTKGFHYWSENEHFYCQGNTSCRMSRTGIYE